MKAGRSISGQDSESEPQSFADGENVGDDGKIAPRVSCRHLAQVTRYIPELESETEGFEGIMGSIWDASLLEAC